MRTTVSIDDHLLAEAKQLAVRNGHSLGSVIDDALRVYLAVRAQSRSLAPVELPVFGTRGLRPGVDLEDKEGLAALLDEERDERAAG